MRGRTFLSAFSFTLVLVAGLMATAARLAAQADGQVPANYHGPTLYGVCVYIVGDTSYYSNLFSTSGYFKFKAQQQFQLYAAAQARPAAPLKSAGCRWSTSHDEIATQKDADKRLLGLPNRSAKGVETGWTFNPGAAPTAVAGQGAGSAQAAAGSPVAYGGAPPAAAGGTRAASSRAATGNSGTTAASGSGATAQGGSGDSGSIAGNAQQSVQGAMADSKAAATSGVNQVVGSTMSRATANATGALSSLQNRLFHKGKPADATAQPAAAATPVSTAQSSTPMGAGNTESALAATAEAQHIEGLVADVAGNDIIINVGVQAGVKPGTKLTIMHPVRTVKDPATGKVIRTVEDKVGDLTITNADATSASGTFSGTSAPKVGDVVRSPKS